MTKIDLKNIEKISDYALALKEEIESDIKKLSNYSWTPSWNNLDDINRKIDLARGYWVKVDDLDKQVLDFRIILFKRRIDSKIEEVSDSKSKLAFEIDDIESEYKELKLEPSLDLGELQVLMHNLYNEVIRSKIKFMINDVIMSDESSIYSIEQIDREMELAKEKWINIDDIKEMLFE